MIKKSDFSLSCPYCSSREIKDYFSLDDNVVRRCFNCRLIFKQVQNDENELLHYYRNHYFDDWERGESDSGRKVIYEQALTLIEQHVGKGVLFDIGSGTGMLPALAIKRNWKEVHGQEISVSSCLYAQQIYGITLLNQSLSELVWKPDCYDAITIINVLDHLFEPWWILKKAFHALKDEGILYARVPNGFLHSILYRFSEKIPIQSIRKKVRQFTVIHLYHFTPYFLRKVFKDAGYGRIAICPAPVSGITTYTSFSPVDVVFLTMIKKIHPFFAELIYLMSRERFVISSSLEILAFKRT